MSWSLASCRTWSDVGQWPSIIWELRSNWPAGRGQLVAVVCMLDLFREIRSAGGPMLEQFGS